MKTHEKREVIEFFKEAFCIDGSVNIIKKPNNLEIKAVVELNDRKRGTFYIGLLKKKGI